MLSGKRILVTGALTRDSIAYAVAEQAQWAGAEVILTGFGRARRLTERAARHLPEPPGEVLELDVNREEDLDALRVELERRWGLIDGILHAIAFAPEDALGGRFLQTTEYGERDRRVQDECLLAEGARAAALAPLLARGASIVGLDFDASVAWPSYDWMGVSKAALEAIARYLARDLGPRGTRVNLISTGPIRSVAASGVPGFTELAGAWGEQAPLGWDTDDATPIAQAACFLFSDLSRAITGEILHVDGGHHPMGAPIR